MSIDELEYLRVMGGKVCKRHRWRALYAPMSGDVDGRICDRCDAVQTIYSMTPRQVARLRKIAVPPDMVRAFQRLFPGVRPPGVSAMLELINEVKCDEQ